MQKIIAAIQPYFTPRVFSMLVLGFPYGMMYFLAIPTLQVWLKQLGISNTYIGFFAWVSLPYMIKFLWAPLVGYIKIPLLGRYFGHRRSWLIMSHFFLMLFLILIGFSEPKDHLFYTAMLSLALAFFAGIQDIVIDAYRIEILDHNQSGPGVGMLITGYRLGSVTAQAGALYIAHHYSWQVAYCIMAILVVMGIIAAVLNPEPNLPINKSRRFFSDYVVPPLKEFFARPGCWYVVVFIVLFRIGDAFINNMANVFYMETGFSITEIANVTKMFGMFPTLVGGIIGGALTVRMNIFNALLLCGISHGLSHFMFIGQSLMGHNIEFLYGVIFLENITGGLATAVFLVYLSQQAHINHTATQYAFYTSVWSAASFIAGTSGLLVDFLDSNWTAFFTFALLISIPGTLLILKLRHFPLPQARFGQKIIKK